jgi:hypothetical protein
MHSRVQSRHEWRATSHPLGHGVPHAEADLPVATGGIGRFEILPELAILTSDILGFQSCTTQVERVPAPHRAATTVTRHPVAEDGQN